MVRLNKARRQVARLAEYGNRCEGYVSEVSEAQQKAFQAAETAQKAAEIAQEAEVGAFQSAIRAEAVAKLKFSTMFSGTQPKPAGSSAMRLLELDAENRELKAILKVLTQELGLDYNKVRFSH